jgi:hypothetical protein
VDIIKNSPQFNPDILPGNALYVISEEGIFAVGRNCIVIKNFPLVLTVAFYYETSISSYSLKVEHINIQDIIDQKIVITPLIKEV